MTRRAAKTGLSESNGKNRGAVWGDFQAEFTGNAELALTLCQIAAGFSPVFVVYCYSKLSTNPSSNDLMVVAGSVGGLPVVDTSGQLIINLQLNRFSALSCTKNC